MAAERIQRRLAAILAAGVVGYSRLMEADEAGTLAALNQHRPGNERLRELMQYATERLEEETLEDPAFSTFECIVNGPEALAWLDAYRPAVAAKIREAS